MVTIEQRWNRLLPAPAVDTRSAGQCLSGLLAAYGQSERHYHGLAHIEALLGLVEAEAHLFRDRAAVELAVLFHDAVYDARDPKGNEAASAALARDRLTELGFERTLVDKVARFVEATAHFAGGKPPDDPDLARFLDLDLAILAAPPAEYDAYAAAIGREYAHVPDAERRPARIRALGHFLARPRIYLCDDHHASWDAPARANLAREIAALTGKAP